MRRSSSRTWNSLRSVRPHQQRLRRARRRLGGHERLEAKELLASDAFHNAADPEDVNADGAVSAIDALMIINAMEGVGSDPSTLFTDVNNDGSRSALDALMVINRLNRRASTRGASDLGGNEAKDPRDAGSLPELSDEFRSIDGTGNNVEDPTAGAAGQNLIRVAAADYADGVSEPAGADRPSAREISNRVSEALEEGITSERGLTGFLSLWGQFLDHDLDLSETPSVTTERESFDISVPVDDGLFNPQGLEDVVIPFTRSDFDPTTGTSVANPRQQFNEITSYIDGSQIYGSDIETAASLRAFSGGRLLITDDGYLPTDDAGNILAGDIRAAENIALTAMHTLFVREHNRIADQLAAEHPELDDEAIYQQARAVVVAELQSITYNEYLPALLGPRALEAYDQYDPSVDPSIANEFSTAAYRFGHSTLNETIGFYDNEGRSLGTSVALADAFFQPSLLEETGIDTLLKAQASVTSQEIDLQVVDGLRNFLFGPPGAGGFDLVALNIQRGRDHGLADYNATREAYGLAAYTSFDALTTDTSLQAELQSLYGSIENVDLWVGLLAEDHVRGASVGELTGTIIADQFERLRDGDRFYYENQYSAGDQRRIERTTLADIVERNTEVRGLQEDVFRFRVELSGQLQAAQTGASRGPRRASSAALAGVTVELVDADGNVVDVDTTDSRGRYAFDGVTTTGEYEVRVPESDHTLDVLIRSGDTRLRGLDFVFSEWNA